MKIDYEILKKLNEAVFFEEFLGKKYVGQKRFSLEGAESIIPALHKTIQLGISMEIEEFVFGMAHRGRLNILANIFEKPYENMFKEFEGVEYLEDEFFLTYGDGLSDVNEWMFFLFIKRATVWLL